MDPLKKTPQKKMILIVLIIIFLQLTLSTWYMVYQKTGFFADDLYSYGFANSPGIFTPLEKNGDVNYNEWISGSVLNEYLTVSPNERFTFGRVYTSLKRDAHPPLFYYLLHAICSFTPGVFSKWSAYIINIVGFIIMQLYLYRLSLYIGKNRFIALLIITFFGFTSATINMMVLFRMHMLATGFTVGFTYYAFRYFDDENGKKLINKDMFLSFVFLYLSAMTVYLSVLFAFLLTLYICINHIIRKDFKRTLCFGFCMLAAVGLMCVSFPVVFGHLFSDKNAIEGSNLYPFMLQLRTCIYVISNGVFGINTPIFPSMIPFYLMTGLIGLCIICALLHFIFRNDNWFTDLETKVKESLSSLISRSRSCLYYLLSFIIITLIFLVLYSKELKIFYYGEFGMRYFYILTPFIALTVLMIILKLIRPSYVRIPIIVILVVLSLFFGSKCYLEKEYENAKISANTKGSNVVVVENEYNLFMYHIMDLIDCKSFLFATPRFVFNGQLQKPLSEKNGESILLLVDQNATSNDSMISRSFGADGREAVYSDLENDLIDYFKTIPGCENATPIGTYYGSYLYRLK